MADGWLFWVLIFPGVIFALWTQVKVTASLSRYSRVPTRRGMTGGEVARTILDAQGLRHIRIDRAAGVLRDHYDPRSQVLFLSKTVFDVPSVAAAGIAAHEAGHALQDADHYAPLELRTKIVPLVQIGSNIAPFLLISGIAFGVPAFIWTGAILFGLSTVFALLTLPVELDASVRALRILAQKDILADGNEMDGAQKVLSAAAWTYVSAAVGSIGIWVFYVLVFTRGMVGSF